MINLFIGTSANGEDAEAELVYEYTLRKNTKEDLTIHWMRLDRSPLYSGWDTRLWSTPFSGFRWTIPEAMGFKGRAIYTDVDMMNFRNIKELYNTDLKGKAIAARRGQRFNGHEFCVMVIDCEKLGPELIPVERMKKNAESHHRFVRKFSGNADFVTDLNPLWNVLDGESLNLSDIYQLHFTDMSTQPWRPDWYQGVSKDHPRQDVVELWKKVYQEAKEAGLNPNYDDYKLKIYYDIIGK